MLAAAARIPFKSEPALGSGSMISALLVACVLLALLYAALRYAHHRGWLERWRVSGIANGASSRKPWHVQSQRVSRRTTVHTLQRDGRTLVVVEHGTGVAVNQWRESSEDAAGEGERA